MSHLGLIPLSLPQPSPSVPPGFPCGSPGSSVLSFPFVSFRPSQLHSHAAPLVLAFRSPSGVLLCFRFLSSASALGSDYSASCRFLSLHPCFPLTAGSSGARLSASLDACCHAFGSASVLSFSCNPFPGLTAVRHRRSQQLPAFFLAASGRPLSLHLRGGFGQSDTP